MNATPTSSALFWALYALGTLVPVVGTSLLSRHHVDDRSFLFSWFLWLIGGGLLIACLLSVRSIFSRNGKVRSLVGVYRFAAWLALLQFFVWAYAVLRVL